MMTSRPVEGVRMRYFWRNLMAAMLPAGRPAAAPGGGPATPPRRRGAAGRVGNEHSLQPRPRLECRVERMLQRSARVRRLVAVSVASILVLAILSGCAIKHPVAK